MKLFGKVVIIKFECIKKSKNSLRILKLVLKVFDKVAIIKFQCIIDYVKSIGGFDKPYQTSLKCAEKWWIGVFTIIWRI